MHHCSAELALLEEEQQEQAAQDHAASNATSTSSLVSNNTPSTSSSEQQQKSKLAFVSSATSTLSKENPKTSSGNQAGDGASISSAAKSSLNNEPSPSLEDSSGFTLKTPSSTSAVKAGDPIEVLHRAWDLTLSEFFELELIGSSTALIALLKDDELRLANIGDCSCSIVRRRGGSSNLVEEQQRAGEDGVKMHSADSAASGSGRGGGGVASALQGLMPRIVTEAENAEEGLVSEEGQEGEYEYIFRSQEQQHSFNYPFQMGTNSKDTPRKDGQFFNVKIQKDDLIIISSDGLVDNLFDEDILEEIERQASSSQLDGQNNGDNAPQGAAISPERLSKALCSRAKAVSEDQRAVTSPFQQKANEEGIHFVGGKHDDITVLVAIIGDKDD